MPQLSPDGHYEWNGTAWVPYVPPVAAPIPPPPPPPPAPVAPQAPPQPSFPQFNIPPPPAPAQPQWGGAPGAVGGGAYDFTTMKWGGGMPIGYGYIVQIEDIEYGESKAGNPKLTFYGKTLEPNGVNPAGLKAIWSYSLNKLTAEGKPGGIGKFGVDMVKLGLTSAPEEPNALVQALLAQLRGRIIVLDAKESKNSDFPDINIIGPYAAQQQSAAPAYQPLPQAPPPPPPAAPAGYAVSFPSTPPPSLATFNAFNKV